MLEEGGFPLQGDGAVAAGATRQDLPFRWVGGRLCLDYANTVVWSSGADFREPDRPRPEYERFTDYARVVAWGRDAGILSERRAAGLLRAAERAPGSAADALQAAMVLREAIHCLFVAVAGGAAADPSSLATLDAVVARGLSHRHLVATGGSFVWAWETEGHVLELPLWPVALSAAELLVSGDLKRVRKCSGNGCGFLFLDKGRGPGRRWCDMAHCGNRAKARRHYRRTRGAE